MARKHFIWHICCLQLVIIYINLSLQDSEKGRKLVWDSQNLDNFLIKNETFFNYINEWNTSISENSNVPQNTYETSSEEDSNNFKIDIYAENVFKYSSNDSTMILTDLTNCLTNYNLFTCVRMLLLSRIKPLVSDLEKFNSTGLDFNLFQGLITLKWRNTTDLKHILNSQPKLKFDASLSHELNSYVLRLFQSRSLQINVFPGLGIEFTPKSVSDQNGIVCFSAKAFKEANFNTTAAVAEMRKKVDKKKKNKNKEGGFNMMPMMIIPQMIMLGMLPFALANLKMMVMNAFMMNSMALNSAIFMTVRNMVFGPKKGPKVKYVNYGYNKKKANKKPELILHSPAAFVKKPAHHQDSHIPPNPNHFDNPNTYSVYKRRNELNKNNFRNSENIRIRIKSPEFLEESNHQNNYGHSYKNPQQEIEADGTSYDNTGVDAPNSYLNNNQYLNPSLQSYPPNNNRYDLSAVDSTTQNNNYMSYDNSNLQSYNDDEFQPSNNENYNNNYNSQYNLLHNLNNKYVNHRIS